MRQTCFFPAVAPWRLQVREGSGCQGGPCRGRKLAVLVKSGCGLTGKSSLRSHPCKFGNCTPGFSAWRSAVVLNWELHKARQGSQDKNQISPLKSIERKHTAHQSMMFTLLLGQLKNDGLQVPCFCPICFAQGVGNQPWPLAARQTQDQLGAPIHRLSWDALPLLRAGEILPL